ncbi:MAG: EAL domain-containing protein [Aquificaceae bacterium]|nr:EAL domain-containing protein [Aquificaceae bacterium]
MVSLRFYILGLLLLPSLIPDLFHIMSIPFFPDFITENKRHKTAYLYLFSRFMVLNALFLSVFSDKLPRIDFKFLTIALSVLSFSVSMFFVLYYPYLPPLFLKMDGVAPPWYKVAYDWITCLLFAFLAIYIKKKQSFGYRLSNYGSVAIALLSLSTFAFSLSLHKHFFDFMIPLSSLFRLAGYGLLSYTILYLGVKREASLIMEDARAILGTLSKTKPVKEEKVFYLQVGLKSDSFIGVIHIYDMECREWIAQVYSKEKKQPPAVDVSFIKNLGGSYFDREYHHGLYGKYLAATEITSESSPHAESPLRRLSIMNSEMILVNYLINWINFDRAIEEKNKELRRLNLLLETSEYATHAHNNIDTFSKNVLEKLISVLKVDGGFFYMWNKKAELPERVVFSTEFLIKFSDLRTDKLIQEVNSFPIAYGIKDNYAYCNYETDAYKVGIVILRLSGGFSQEELFFLKTVSNQLFHVIRLMKIIEDLEKAQADIRFLTEYDPLTTLYNRSGFEKSLEREIERSNRSGETFCAVFLDVDNLKVINDNYGYSVGDLLLKSIADSIKNNVRKLDIVGRLGSDEFCIVMPKLDTNLAVDVVNRLRQKIMEKSVVVEDVEIKSSVSMGVVCYPTDAKSKEEILSIGEVLVHEVKRGGKGSVKFVDESVKEIYKTHKRFKKDILDSLEKGSVEVFLQEIFSLTNQRVEAFETLMRLVVRDEIINAGSFIHIAEQMGIIQRLDLAMVQKLFSYVSQFKEDGEVLLFLNLSPKDFNQEFMKEAMKYVENYNIKPERVVFEITEREAIQDIFKVGDFIKNMKAMGFKFAIDDFGAGYASFFYIKYLPVDFLKIEGEFIKSIKKSEVDRIFVKSIVDIAKGLGIKTIAEFVEDQETLEILYHIGVDYAQGYYIGKPGPAQEKLNRFFST